MKQKTSQLCLPFTMSTYVYIMKMIFNTVYTWVLETVNTSAFISLIQFLLYPYTQTITTC